MEYLQVSEYQNVTTTTAIVTTSTTAGNPALVDQWRALNTATLYPTKAPLPVVQGGGDADCVANLTATTKVKVTAHYDMP